MQPSTKAYSPEQAAFGALDNGKEVMILYIKEFFEQLSRVNKSGKQGYFYTWNYLEEQNAYVLFIYWDNEEEVAILFTKEQRELVRELQMPKNLIITALPLKKLIESAENSGQDFFDLDGPAVILNDVVYNGPMKLSN